MAFSNEERTLISVAKLNPTLSEIYKVPPPIEWLSLLSLDGVRKADGTDEDKGHVMETDEQIVNKMMPLIDAVIELQKVVSLLPKAQDVKKIATTVSLLKDELKQVAIDVANQESQEPEPPKRQWWKK